jgi:hypothetical protein
MADPWSNLRCCRPKSEMTRTALACCTALALLGAAPATACTVSQGSFTPCEPSIPVIQHLERVGVHFPIPPPVPIPRPVQHGGPTAAVMQAVYKPNTHVIYNDLGGVLREYDDRYRLIASRDIPVEIRGSCESACTLIMAHVPKERICFSAGAALRFHKARTADGNPRHPRHPVDGRQLFARDQGLAHRHGRRHANAGR